jgi:hypothetical protein
MNTTPAAISRSKPFSEQNFIIYRFQAKYSFWNKTRKKPYNAVIGHKINKTKG